jgi:hypothetical protein
MRMTEQAQQAPGGGLNEAAAMPAGQEPLGSTGGSSGSGAISGRGEPSGGTLDHSGGALAGTPKDAGENAQVAAGADSLSAQSENQIASEAAALGSADGSLADAARAGSAAQPGVGPTGAEAIGSGAGRGEIGSGTPADRGELGGGGPLGQHGGTGPAGAG